MSHTAEVQVDIRPAQHLDCLKRACRRVGAEYLGNGRHVLFDGSHTGYGVKLKGWRYPMVIETGGDAKYDNYGGSWGDADQIQKLKQAYAAEVAHKEACKTYGKQKVKPIRQQGKQFVVEVNA